MNKTILTLILNNLNWICCVICILAQPHYKTIYWIFFSIQIALLIILVGILALSIIESVHAVRKAVRNGK